MLVCVSLTMARIMLVMRSQSDTDVYVNHSVV
jgi:hypothetical protein